MGRFCTQCGKPLAAAAKFCGECGAAVTGTGGAAGPPAAASPAPAAVPPSAPRGGRGIGTAVLVLVLIGLGSTVAFLYFREIRPVSVHPPSGPPDRPASLPVPPGDPAAVSVPSGPSPSSPPGADAPPPPAPPGAVKAVRDAAARVAEAARSGPEKLAAGREAFRATMKPENRAVFRDLLADPDPAVALLGVEALVALRDIAAVPDLLRREAGIRDAAEAVQRADHRPRPGDGALPALQDAILQALLILRGADGRLHPQAVVRWTDQAVREKDPDAAGRLFSAGPDGAEAVLAEVRAGRIPPYWIAGPMERLQGSGAPAVFDAVMRDENLDPDLRGYAMDALEGLGAVPPADLLESYVDRWQADPRGLGRQVLAERALFLLKTHHPDRYRRVQAALPGEY